MPTCGAAAFGSGQASPARSPGLSGSGSAAAGQGRAAGRGWPAARRSSRAEVADEAERLDLLQERPELLGAGRVYSRPLRRARPARRASRRSASSRALPSPRARPPPLGGLELALGRERRDDRLDVAVRARAWSRSCRQLGEPGFVARVSGQSLHVGDELRRHSEALDDPGPVVDFLLHWVEHRDVVADELHQVFVAAHDAHAVPARRRCVARVAMMSSASKPSNCRTGMSIAATSRQVSSNCGTRSSGAPRDWLVLRIEGVAEVLGARIEGDAEQRRLFFAQELAEHPCEAGDRVRRYAGRGGERSHRVVGAEDVAAASTR